MQPTTDTELEATLKLDGELSAFILVPSFENLALTLETSLNAHSTPSSSKSLPTRYQWSVVPPFYFDEFIRTVLDFIYGSF